MDLSRRDALAALAALGAAGGTVAVTSRSDDGPSGSRDEPGLPDDERVRTTLTAVAEVVYPGELTGVEAFVATFVDGRLDGSDHATGLRDAVAELDRLARDWHGDPVADLPPDDRDRLLRQVGADTAEEAPDGTTAERIRYYVVNDLLLALYASPTGGELVGIENPQGHPGGTDSYRRGPP